MMTDENSIIQYFAIYMAFSAVVFCLLIIIITPHRNA